MSLFYLHLTGTCIDNLVSFLLQKNKLTLIFCVCVCVCVCVWPLVDEKQCRNLIMSTKLVVTCYVHVQLYSCSTK